MGRLKRKQYEKLLEPLEEELVMMARWAKAKQQRICVLFEGRDTAGKGGAIHAISGRLNPRQCRIAALGTPNEREKSQWYFQRYVPHLPSAGEIVLFDRSWYNRAGVEQVMNFTPQDKIARFLNDVPVFEQALVSDGILLFKYWLATDQAQQEARLHERLEDPLKRWKLSPIDLAARKKYAEYTQAREAMLRATDSAHAPWTLVDFNDQKRGRLTLIRDLLDRLPDTNIDPEPLVFPELDHPPQKESYAVVKPIADFPIDSA